MMHVSQWAESRSISSCVSADNTITGKHPAADTALRTTYGDLENWLSGWLDWKLQVTDVELLTTSFDLKVHRRIPAVPFCTITSGSAWMSMADAGFETVNECNTKVSTGYTSHSATMMHVWASARRVCCGHRTCGVVNKRQGRQLTCGFHPHLNRAE